MCVSACSLLPPGDVSIHVVTGGDYGSSKPILLFVHGFPENWATWQTQLVYFARLGFPVAAMDLRGYGLSSAPAQTSAYCATAAVSDVTKVVHALRASSPQRSEVDREVIVVGHDVGGVIAWHLAFTKGNDDAKAVSKFVLINAPHPSADMHTPGKTCTHERGQHTSIEAAVEFARSPSTRAAWSEHLDSNTSDRCASLCVLFLFPSAGFASYALHSDRFQFIRSWYILFFQLPLVPELVMLSAPYRMARLFSSCDREMCLAQCSSPSIVAGMLAYYRAAVRSALYRLVAAAAVDVGLGHDQAKSGTTPAPYTYTDVAPVPVNKPVLQLWGKNDTLLGRAMVTDLPKTWTPNPQSRIKLLEATHCQ